MASTPSQLLVMSVLQWSVFLGLGFLIFGWTEKKKKLSMIGYGVFILAGIFSAYALFAGMLNAEIEAERNLLMLLWGALGIGFLSIPACIAKWKGLHWRVLNIFIAGLSLLLFMLLTQRSFLKRERTSDVKNGTIEKVE